MGDISEHFNRKEFACKCGCGFDKIDMILVQKLEQLRALLGNKPIHIDSGCRCTIHNIAVHGRREKDGKQGSQHLYGKAADIKVEGVKPSQVADVAEQLGFGGIGRYKTFTHLDVRRGKARWHG